MRFPSLSYAAILLGAPALMSACSSGAPAIDDRAEEPASAPIAASAVRQAKADEYRFHAAPAAGLRFPVLRAGVMVEERRFDPSLPASKFRHAITLSTEAGTAVVINVWDNPDRLELNAWFEANLAFLAEDRTSVSERPMTRARVSGFLVEQALSQAPSQEDAVFALGDKIVRVSAVDPDGNPTARALFERVIAQIEPEVTR